jgi:two-component system, NtrC family, sensor kinase
MRKVSAAALLEHIGLVVRCSSNAQAGLELLARGDWQPRLVVTDIVMPGASNGLTLARLLRKTRPEIAVILCTGVSQSASEAAEDGFTILRKPYQPEELERQIITALRSLGHAATGV